MLNIGHRAIGLDAPPFIIAEIGVNHDGAEARALSLLHAAAEAGADAVKFQLFEAKRLLSASARLAAYQEESGAENPFAMLAELELSVDAIGRLVEAAHQADVAAIVSVFSVELVDPMAAHPVDAFKTASTDIINRPLINAMMVSDRPLLLSTGAATDHEIRRASAWLGDHPHVLMHCVSAYPTPDESAALGGRMALEQLSPHAIGYSDHTTAVDTGAFAIAGGACVLEKHFTDDRTRRGPDHAASLEPDGFARYVELAHRAWRMRGPLVKRVLDVEQEVRSVSRQSLTWTTALDAGVTVEREHVTIKRPGAGIEPWRLEEILGRTTCRAVEGDRPIVDDDLS
jgi:sialic acid synthase SpsE